MKRPGKLITNTTLALCGSSIILASCDGYFVDDDLVKTSDLLDEGEPAIKIEFTQEDTAYLTFLNKLGHDIIQNSLIAQDFAKDPQSYFEKYGYREKIDLDESLLHYVLTLGDPDIHDAIAQRDIARIIHLMKDRCLITNNYSKVKMSDEDISRLAHLYGLSKKTLFNADETNLADNQKFQSVVAVFAAVVWIFVAVVEDAVAAYNVGVGLNIGAYATVYHQVAAWGMAKASLNTTSEKIAIETNLSFKAISAKIPELNDFVLANQYIEDFSAEVANAIEKETPEILQELNREEIQNLVKYNMFLKATNHTD